MMWKAMAAEATAVFQHLKGDYREDRARISQRCSVKQEGKITVLDMGNSDCRLGSNSSPLQWVSTGTHCPETLKLPPLDTFRSDQTRS